MISFLLLILNDILPSSEVTTRWRCNVATRQKQRYIFGVYGAIYLKFSPTPYFELLRLAMVKK